MENWIMFTEAKFTSFTNKIKALINSKLSEKIWHSGNSSISSGGSHNMILASGKAKIESGDNNAIIASGFGYDSAERDIVKGDGNAIMATAEFIVDGSSNFIGGGYCPTVRGIRNGIIGGFGLTASGYNFVTGRCNATPAEGTYYGINGDALVVGIGADGVNKNGFRVDYSGNAYASKTMNSTGADYAEAWEWEDGNPNSEDRVGRFVAFEGTKIRLATANDPKEILGVISALPAVVGDNFADDWHGMYLKDKFGRLLTEHKAYDAAYDKNGNLLHEACEVDEYIVNPYYDPTQEYIPRLERPEYDAVGTHGKLVVIDDGTCQVGGFCMPSGDGIATASESGFYVMERIDETAVKIYVR